MADLGQSQTGTLRSMPKICAIKGDDNMALIYKNMGNNHAYPFVWSESVTMSGTTHVLMVSGTKFHGISMTSAKVQVTPVEDTGAVRIWIEKDTSADTVSIKSSASISNIDFDVLYMLGANADVSTIYCRGNTGAQQSLP